MTQEAMVAILGFALAIFGVWAVRDATKALQRAVEHLETAKGYYDEAIRLLNESDDQEGKQ